MKIEHIGIAVLNLENSLAIFKDLLGIAPSSRETVSSENVKLAIFNVGDTKIELLEGIDDTSSIKKFLNKKKKDTIHHIAIKVDDLNEKIRHLEAKNYKLIDGYPKGGKEGSMVAFLHPGSTGGILIELVET